jgi:hypothetical protein
VTTTLASRVAINQAAVITAAKMAPAAVYTAAAGHGARSRKPASGGAKGPVRDEGLCASSSTIRSGKSGPTGGRPDVALGAAAVPLSETMERAMLRRYDRSSKRAIG